MKLYGPLITPFLARVSTRKDVLDSQKFPGLFFGCAHAIVNLKRFRNFEAEKERSREMSQDGDMKENHIDAGYSYIAFV